MWRDLFTVLEKIGLTQIILPFVIIFTIVYALLEKIDLFKKDGQTFTAANAVVAFVLAFFVISATHILQVTNMMSRIFAMGVLLVLLFSIMLAFFGIELEQKVKYVIPVAVGLTGVTALYVLTKYGYINLNINALLSYIIYPAVSIFIFILVIWFIVGEDTSLPKKPAETRGRPREIAKTTPRKQQTREPEQPDKEPDSYKYVKDKSIKKPKEKKRFHFKD